MENRIKAAIENKLVIEFYYKNDLRKVEPFVLGIANNGNILLRAFQVGGESTDSSSYSWKLFTVNKISELRLSGENFRGERTLYNPNDSVFNEIYARI